jgi:hypothetical protein
MPLLSKPNVAESPKCIRLDLDCADVSTVTLRVTSRQPELRRQPHPAAAGGVRDGLP